jgi:hypothetical protein
MQELLEDLLLALYRQHPALVISVIDDGDGKMRGFTEEDQVPLDLYNAVKDLPRFDGVESLIIIRMDPNKKENEKSREERT